MKLGIWAYPWDVADTGISDFIDELDALGVSQVNLAFLYHSARLVLPSNSAHRVFFAKEGAAYFRPDVSAYPEPWLVPPVDEMVRSFDVARKLGDAMARRRKRLVAWVVCNHNSRVGDMDPGLCAENVFGDHYPYQLCPANPFVRDYLAALAKDIAANYPVSGVLLETPGYMPFRHGYHHEISGVELTTLEEFLFSLCFCKHCMQEMQRIGIDARQARHQAKTLLGDLLDLPPHEKFDPIGEGGTGLEDALCSWPELLRYVEARPSVVNALVEHVHEAVAPTGVPLGVSTLPPAAAWLEATDLAQLASRADFMSFLNYSPSGEAVLGAGRAVMEVTGGRVPVHSAMRCGLPDVRSDADLIERVLQLDKVGIDACVFYNYGIMPRYDRERIGLASRALGDTLRDT